MSKGIQSERELLFRYVDGQLEPGEEAAVTRLLEQRPALAAQVFEFAEQQLAVEQALRETRPVALREAGPARHSKQRRRPLRGRIARPAPAWGWWITGIAAAVLVAFGLLFLGQWDEVGRPPFSSHGSPVASVAALVAPVTVVRANATFPLRVKDPLFAGDRIVTQTARARMVVGYDDNTQLTLHGETTLGLRKGAVQGQKLAAVERGRIEAAVARQAPDRPMVVRTPHAEVTVVGTKFVVSVEPQASRVEVAEGKVSVKCLRNGRTTVLSRGYHAVAGQQLVVAARPAFGSGRARATGRVTDGLCVLYTFGEGSGGTVRDVSGVGKALDLVIEDPGAVAWLEGGGLGVRRPTRIRSGRFADKIIKACRRSNEVSVEAWVQPALTEQGGPSRIVAVARTYTRSNFVLGMGVLEQVRNPAGTVGSGPCYVARLRTSITPEPPWAGQPLTELVTAPGTVSRALTHVVFARTADGTIRIVLDGEDRFWASVAFVQKMFDESLRTKPGDLSAWLGAAHLFLANSPDHPRPWLGDYHLIAVYSRALSLDEIRRNYAAGARGADGATRAARP